MVKVKFTDHKLLKIFLDTFRNLSEVSLARDIEIFFKVTDYF